MEQAIGPKQGIIPTIVRTYSLGIVKQVISGDTLVIRDRPVDGPPPERTIVLTNIFCGRIGRKPNVTNPAGVAEDPYAWAAREFVRSNFVGKEVCYTIENELQSGRKYGTVHEVEEGLAEVRKLSFASEKNQVYQKLLTAQETAKSLRKGRWSEDNKFVDRDIIWTVDDMPAFLEKYKHIHLKAIIEQVRDGSTLQLVLLPESLKENPTTHVNITLSMTGIKAPYIRYDDGKLVSEHLANDAQFFVESRLLQREVTVLLESVIQQNFSGTILHPNGNITELLLRQGLARCIDWNLRPLCTPGAIESYKLCETFAKENRLRLWENYITHVEREPSKNIKTLVSGTKFTGKIIEVGTGHNVSVACSDGVERKFFLSSIRAARVNKEEEEIQRGRIRPLYDIPYAFETREALRNFVGHSVEVNIDYIQPKTSPRMTDRDCATIQSNGTNLALLLVSNGLAFVIRYRNATDARSIYYGELLTAEAAAKTNGLGVFNKQPPPTHRVADLVGNVAKSRQFLGMLKRVEYLDAVVEFVFNASRFRCYVTRELCELNFLLSGIQCPRKGRVKMDGDSEPDQPFSKEAYNFVRSMCMQRDLEIKIDTIDRVGNFVGWMFLNNLQTSSVAREPIRLTGKKKKKTELNVPKPKVNMSVLLVSHGLATVHRALATEQSPYYTELMKAEEEAKSEKCGLWSSEVFIKQWEAQMNEANDPNLLNGEDDASTHQDKNMTEYWDDLSTLSLNCNKEPVHNHDSKLIWKSVQITSISRPPGSQGFRFFAQDISDASIIMQISHSLNSQSLPSLPPDHQLKKGDICAACFSADNCWYRARVIRCLPKSMAVQFIDFGNEETINSAEYMSRISLLIPGPLMSLPPKISEYRLAFVQLPTDQLDRNFAEQAFTKHVENKEVRIANLFDSVPCGKETSKPVPAVTMILPAKISDNSGSLTQSHDVDINTFLLSEGLVFVEPLPSQLLKRLPQDLVLRYLDAQARARKAREKIWRYGDFRVDINEA